MKRATITCLKVFTLMVFGFGCSNAGLQPVDPDDKRIYDDKLLLTGEVCTSEPKASLFPVKVLFLIDSSGSMQFTDPADANTVSFDSSYRNCIASAECPNGELCRTGLCTAASDARANCMAACTNDPADGGAGLPAGQCAPLCSNADSPGRQAAIQKVIDRFKNNPVVEFAIVRFNARVTVNGGEPGCDGFTRKANCLKKGIDSLTQAEIFTDYQGALSKAYELLEQDMIDSDVVERTRTKYVIVFISDGSPDPQCKKGCGNDAYLGQTYEVCDMSREQWCSDAFPLANSAQCRYLEKWYPSMAEPCKAYNTQSQITQRVSEIRDLGSQYGVGELRFHTGFLAVPDLPPEILGLFYKPDPAVSGESCSNGEDEDGDALVDCKDPDCDGTIACAEALLQAMAKAGDGLHRNFTSGQQIDFLDINYASVSRPFGLTNIIVTNTNAWPNETGLVIDSDGDGIGDEAEFNENKKLLDSTTDSDGDGYNDKLELMRINAGFDPGDPSIPPKACVDDDDKDGDGLRGCEEKILGTNSTLADSDRDRIPDGMEFLWGTNPVLADTKIDVDFDGKSSGDEIRFHADPAIRDPQIHANFRYVYDVHPAKRLDRKQCYDFTVRNIRLVTTLGTTAGSQGQNEILIYFGEGPADDPRDFGNFKAACVRVQYVAPNYKSPADGKIHVRSSDFYDLRELLDLKQLAQTDPTVDPCVTP